MKKNTRAKFFLRATPNDDGSMNVSGWPVTDGSEENKVFSEFTPSGTFSIHIAKDAPAQKNFEPHVAKEYYIDITEAPAKEVATTATDETKK